MRVPDLPSSPGSRRSEQMRRRRAAKASQLDTEDKVIVGCLGFSILGIIIGLLIALAILGVVIWGFIAVVKEYTQG